MLMDVGYLLTIIDFHTHYDAENVQLILLFPFIIASWSNNCFFWKLLIDINVGESEVEPAWVVLKQYHVMSGVDDEMKKMKTWQY